MVFENMGLPMALTNTSSAIIGKIVIINTKPPSLWPMYFLLPRIHSSPNCSLSGSLLLVSAPVLDFLGFPGGSDDKESACYAGDLGSIPGLGRSSGGGHGNPLQYSCLENSMDTGSSGLQSMESQTVRHDWATNIHTQAFLEAFPDPTLRDRCLSSAFSLDLINSIILVSNSTVQFLMHLSSEV